MRLEEAVKIFEIQDIAEINKEVLKTTYRSLMKKYHPDVCPDGTEKAQEINEAYDVLSSVIKDLTLLSNVKSKDAVVCVIPLEWLPEIYKGKTYSIKSSQDKSNPTLKIDKGSIRKYRTILNIPVDIKIDNTVRNYNIPVIWRIDDNYEVDIELEGKYRGKGINIQVGLLDKQLNLSMKDQIALLFKFEPGIKVKICLSCRKEN